MKKIPITLLALAAFLVYSLPSFSQCGKSCCGKSQALSGFIERDNSKTVQVKVSGMNSKKSEKRIHASLSKLSGVVSINPEFRMSSVFVTYNPGLTSEEQIASTIENAKKGIYAVEKILPVSNSLPQSGGGCCGGGQSGCSQ